MYRKMLVPLDGSEHSECTLAHVQEVACAHQVAEVILLTVSEPVRQPATAYLGTHEIEDVEKRSVASAREYLETTARGLNVPSAVRTDVVSGLPAEAILDYVEKNRVDLVVMSTHGRSGPSKWLIVSVAEKVIARSPAPVFLIPSPLCRATL